MAYLVDTNVFLRLVPKNDPLRNTALHALEKLRRSNEDLLYTTQLLAEFLTVCTRPATARGGYGLSFQEAERKIRVIERFCRLIPDSLATHVEWRRLIAAYSVKGVEVHDARLVASMVVHRVTQILTFDVDDFKRYQEIKAVSPADICAV
jgi:predicted nucleic acid-binding protein